MPLWSDFKNFAFKGNIVDLAIGVIIGAAFGKIVTALVSNIIMPVVSLIMPTGNWRNAGIILKHAPKPEDNVVLKYGDFLGTCLDFFIVAFTLFLVISKVVKNIEARLSGPEQPNTKDCPFCYEKIPLKATKCKACTSEVPAI